MATRRLHETPVPTLPPPLPPSASAPAGTPPASAADRLGLAAPAQLLADLIRPVAWFGTQALLILEPALRLLGAGPAVGRLAQSLERLDSPQEDA